MFEWQFQLAQNINADDNHLVKSIHDVYLDGFGLQKGWSIGGIKETIAYSTMLGLLLAPDQEICGYAFYVAPDQPLQETYLLWEDAICLKKKAQGKQLSSQALNLAYRFLRARKFGWIGGRTQNPLVIKRYSKFGALFPFHATYTEGEGKLVMDYLSQHIAEVRDVKQLEKNIGICRGAYKEGRLGDYSMQVSDTDDYERSLLEWNFQRENGDAVIVVSKLT